MRDMLGIKRKFGTVRGAARLALSYGQCILPNARKLPVKKTDIRRLVFVCHGNICRSAFAEYVARDLGLNAVSFGLSTTTGKKAHPPVIEYASIAGLVLNDHSVTAVEDFIPGDGDLLLAMEFRHLDKLAKQASLAGYPRDLLGLYHTPPVPHLHDPYQLNAVFLPVCLDRTRRAVHALAAAYPCAKSV